MKLTNQVLREALKLEAEIKKLTERLTDIKKEAKKKGSFCTSQYAVSVKDQVMERLVGKEPFIDLFGKEKLKTLGLIETIQFKIVKIAPKVKTHAH